MVRPAGIEPATLNLEGSIEYNLPSSCFASSFLPDLCLSIVLPHLMSGQIVAHCKPSVPQRIQLASSSRFSRDSQVYSLVNLVRDPRLSSAAMGFQ